MKDLDTLGGPEAWVASINERGQMVGWSYTDSTPNDVPGIKVGDVNFINDRGEIAATGVLPNGDHHAILLVPGKLKEQYDTEIAKALGHATITFRRSLGIACW